MKIKAFKGVKFDPAHSSKDATEARLAAVEAKTAKHEVDIDELKKKGGAK
jgi:hypothetical protein